MIQSQHLERLDGLALFLQEPARQLLAKSESILKRPLLVVSCWRSVQEQLLHYQKGRSFSPDTGEWEVVDADLIVTRAKPGGSAHNVITRQGERAAMGFDVIPFLLDGTPDWNVGDEFWDRLYEFSWKCGLDPLGDTVGAYLKADAGHFEEPGWKMKITGLGYVLPDWRGVAV